MKPTRASSHMLMLQNGKAEIFSYTARKSNGPVTFCLPCTCFSEHPHLAAASAAVVCIVPL